MELTNTQSFMFYLDKAQETLLQGTKRTRKFNPEGPSTTQEIQPHPLPAFRTNIQQGSYS